MMKRPLFQDAPFGLADGETVNESLLVDVIDDLLYPAYLKPGHDSEDYLDNLQHRRCQPFYRSCSACPCK